MNDDDKKVLRETFGTDDQHELTIMFAEGLSKDSLFLSAAEFLELIKAAQRKDPRCKRRRDDVISHLLYHKPKLSKV